MLGIGNEVVDRPRQRAAVGQQAEIGLWRLHVQLTALLAAKCLGASLHLGQQPLHRCRGHHLVVAVAGKQQDVADLLFKILQARHQLLLELVAGFRLEGAVGQVGGIEHGGGERRADLVGQRGGHVAKG